MEGLKVPSYPKAVRLLIILVAITVVLSLLFAAQYYLGGPVRLAVTSELVSLALSPDRSLVAAGAKDGRVRVWQVPGNLSSQIREGFDVTQEAAWPVRTLSGHKGAIILAAFTPDGAALITVSSAGEVWRWSGAAEPAEKLLQLDSTPLVGASLSADRSLLATVNEDGTIQVLDLTAGKEIQSVGPTAEPGRALALSADGSLVGATDGPNVQVWDVQTGASVQSLIGKWDDVETEDAWLGHNEEVTALAFSPDNSLVASGSADTTLLFWDLEAGEVASTSDGHWATVTAIVFNEDGDQLLSGGEDNKLRTFRVVGGKVTATFEGHLAGVNQVAYGPLDDTLLSAGNDGTLRVWETGNQYVTHLEWSKSGFQPLWGQVLAGWMLISGLLGLAFLWGLWRAQIWSHLAALAMYSLGPVVVLGLPLLEVLAYPTPTSVQLAIAWPLVVLVGWYVMLFVILMRRKVAVFFEAPQSAALADQIQVSRRTQRLRFGVFGMTVWLVVLVVLFSVLRRFNLDVAFMGHFFSFIMGGASKTFYISAASIALAVILALLGALGRLSKSPIANGLSSFYVSLIRGTPLLVQIYIWYLGLPRLGWVLPAEVAGILALGVNYGAYMTEVFRAGIQAIGKGQYEAAEALGMSRGQTFQRVVLPQAFRIVIPPIGNEFIAMMKDSSLVSVMSIWELTYRAQKIGRQNFRNMETFLIAAAFYWILTVVFQFLQGKLEEHMARSERR